MHTRLQKWGNSHAVRIPMALLSYTDLKENDEIEISVEKGNIIISPVKKHKTLKDRIQEYNGNYKCGEWKTEESVGKEVF